MASPYLRDIVGDGGKPPATHRAPTGQSG